MKYLIIAFLLVFGSASLDAQVLIHKTRKARRAEKEAKIKEEVKTMIDSKNFIFEATHALPMGGGSIYLTHQYDIEFKNDSVKSYLPFFGVAYRVEYGGRDSGFMFEEAIKDYKSQKKKGIYHVNFKVDRSNDHLQFHFMISELGYTTLNVTSTNRQGISYHGKIAEKEKNDRNEIE